MVFRNLFELLIHMYECLYFIFLQLLRPISYITIFLLLGWRLSKKRGELILYK